METRANLVTVGVFVLAVIAAGFLSMYWLLRGSEGELRATVTVVFPGSVSGLVTGANVTFNGIKVGEVSKLSFAADNPAEVVATVTVDAATPIKVDSHVSLGYQGLTGVSYVQIWGGSKPADPILVKPDGERVMLAERSSVQDILEGAQKLLRDAFDPSAYPTKWSDVFSLELREHSIEPPSYLMHTNAEEYQQIGRAHV